MMAQQASTNRLNNVQPETSPDETVWSSARRQKRVGPSLMNIAVHSKAGWQVKKPVTSSRAVCTQLAAADANTLVLNAI